MSIEFKSFSFSFLIHTAVAAVYFFYFYTPVVFKNKEIQNITINLIEEKKASTLPQTKVVEKKVEMQKKEKVQKEVKQKPEKPQVKTQPVIQKVVQQPQKTTIEKKIQNEPIKQEELVKNTTPQKVSKPIEKTNFEIIRDKVLSHVEYPKIAKKMKHTGVVHLVFIIGKDGLIKDIRIQKSSGKKTLDKAALQAAIKLKTEVLPKPQQTSTVVLPVSFQLKS